MINNIYDYEKLKSILKTMLSEKRFTHSVNVSIVAEDLAKKYGVDPQKAKIAGLLHDICKEMPDEENEKLINEIPKDLNICSRKILHGPAASVYIKNEFGIDDEEILNAVKYHTTGRKNMSMLEKIIFTADYISPERKWEDLEYSYNLSFENLDLAVLWELSTAIKACVDKKRCISKNTFEAYNESISKLEETKQ